MLANKAYKHSVKSLRSLVSFYGNDEILEASLLASLDSSCARIIHLPPSLDSSDSISPALWNWVGSGDFNSELSCSLAADATVMAYSGQSLQNFPPPHLLSQNSSKSSSSETLGTATIPSRIAKRTMRKSVLGNGSDTLAVFKQDALPGTPRFLLHLCTIRLKSQVPSVYCRIHLGTQRFYTASYSCVKDGGKGVSVDINEAFLFDLPEREQFTVSVYLYTTAAPSFIGMHAAGAADTLLGHLSFSLPVSKEFPKVSGRYSFANKAKKDIGKCGIKIGLFMDPEPKYSAAKMEAAPFAGYLNFWVRSPVSFGIWRKYWCVLGRDVLGVYDFEYKTDSPAIGYIPVEYIKDVRDADKHIIGTNNTLEVTVSSKFLPKGGCSVETLSSPRDLNDDQWERVWRRSVADSSVDAELELPVVYVMAETTADLNQWRDELTKSVLK